MLFRAETVVWPFDGVESWRWHLKLKLSLYYVSPEGEVNDLRGLMAGLYARTLFLFHSHV